MEHIEALVERLKRYNDAYRAGHPIISDEEYDRLVERLREQAPNHPYLHTVEPEVLEGKVQVRHPAPMLSIEKAYTPEELERFINRVLKAAAEIGLKTVRFRMTPKLDGLAGRDDGTIFATRGNGTQGYEISRAFKKGVIPVGGRGQGLGEIVVVQSYFEEHLSDEFEHPRNMCVGIVSSDTLNEFARKALEDGVVHFVPYASLPYWEGTDEELISGKNKIIDDLTEQTKYPIDGMVASVTSPDLRDHMGATAHHYRWQIAIKTKGETAVTRVSAIRWQVGRTGKVTPVLEVSPISLSGATIRNVTAHHAGMIRQRHIGVGAEIEVIRSGEVIPKIERVVEPSDDISIPAECPVCSEPLDWHNDFLKCANRFCRAQIEQSLTHWFKTLGNADWFGIKTVQKLVQNGYDSLEKIYAMTVDDFTAIGFGPVQSKNLSEATIISRTRTVEDWRFLAAFGIPDLGTGDSRNLLAHFQLEQLFTITAEDIKNIHGFGEITSRSIAHGISRIQVTLKHMLDLGFNLQRTPLAEETRETGSPVSGKGIVFTGKMTSGSRETMQAQARDLGATVQTAVSSKTDILVCGEKVGAKKIEKARKLGTQVISEEDYLEMVGRV